MIALYLLAAHMVGDFVLQSRWMAGGKLDRRELRVQHVVFYGVAFVPLVVWRIAERGVWWHPPAFFALLLVLHYLTDSRRFRSTFGDWLVWKAMDPEARADELERRQLRRLSPGEYHSTPALLRLRPSAASAARAKVPPNEWAPTPILVDQALHLCQLAILGGLFLQ